MKKLLRSLLFAALPLTAFAQITVSTSQYTSQQLVNNVLLSNSCYPATNITSVTGTNFASVNGIGYFQNNNSGFAFENGIILSSGDATIAPGPIAGDSSGTSQWAGDNDINSFMFNYFGSSYSSQNASALEFDFTPLQDHISLNYIYASNEYGTYQCSFGDSVIILLKDLTSGTSYTNIAVIPTTSTPINTTTIRNAANNPGCASVNPQYFGTYYASNPTTASINFRGATVPLTAEATVTPGHAYHLKIVVADRQDSSYDSAVFIEGGSLNIGAFNDFIVSAEGDNICSSEGVTLSVYPELGTGFSYQWSKDGVFLPEETSILSVTAAGEYSVVATHEATGCSQTRSITVVAGSGLPIELNLTDLVAPDVNNDGFAIFDLTAVTTQIDSQTGQPEVYNVSYYETPDDAEYAANAISNPTAYANIAPNSQFIYIRVDKTDSGCYDVLSANLIAAPVPDAPTGESTQTANEGATLADLEVEGENILWYDNNGEMPDFPDSTGEPLPLSTVLVDGTTYYASQTINGVESAQRLAVTVNLILGVNENIFATLQYYPNPTNGILNIENTNNIDTVTVVNTLGQSVIAKSINSNIAQLDISSLSKGVYFVTVTSGNAVKTVKVIKN